MGAQGRVICPERARASQTRVTGRNLPGIPEWFGKWLADRSEPHPSARVSFSALEADFRSWAEGRSAPKMRSHKFARLIRAACEEVGLAVEGQMVVGLRLMSVHRMLAAA